MALDVYNDDIMVCVKITLKGRFKIVFILMDNSVIVRISGYN